MAAGEQVTGPGIPLACRIVKDCSSKPWQGTASANFCVFRGGKYRNWDEVSMANALEAVRRGEAVRRCLIKFCAKYRLRRDQAHLPI